VVHPEPEIDVIVVLAGIGEEVTVYRSPTLLFFELVHFIQEARKGAPV
jgi:hypothetical protein